jgi:hypothetical protein
MTTSRQQARSDDRDGSRVGMFVSIMFALVFLGALLYFFAVDKRGEGPAHEASPPAANTQGVPGTQGAPGTGARLGPDGAVGTSPSPGSVAPQAAPAR